MSTPAPFPPALETAITEALAMHTPTPAMGSRNKPGGNFRYCTCGAEVVVFYAELDDDEVSTDPRLNAKLAAHQAAVVMETIAQHMTAEALAETRAGLALANAAFGEGLSAGIRACNEAEDGKPFVKPVSPYSAPLLAMIRQEVKA